MSEKLFAIVEACHIRNISRKRSGNIHATGATCAASVGWFPGNRMPSFHARLEGINAAKRMFPKLGPVFSVNGWDLDGKINLIKSYAS